MKTLAERIKLVMKESGMTQVSLADKIGVKQQTVQSICSGRIKRSRYTHDIADKLGVNHDWLLSGDGDKWLQNDEGALINPPVKYVPILRWEESAEWDELRNTPNALKNHTLLPVIGDVNPSSFALQVTGDSMLSDDSYSIPDGSIIIVDPVKEPEHKSLVVVSIPETDDIILRLLSVEGSKRYLKASNTSYPDAVIEFPRNGKMLGVVSMSLRSFINFF